MSVVRTHAVYNLHHITNTQQDKVLTPLETWALFAHLHARTYRHIHTKYTYVHASSPNMLYHCTNVCLCMCVCLYVFMVVSLCVRVYL